MSNQKIVEKIIYRSTRGQSFSKQHGIAFAGLFYGPTAKSVKGWGMPEKFSLSSSAKIFEYKSSDAFCYDQGLYNKEYKELKQLSKIYGVSITTLNYFTTLSEDQQFILNKSVQQIAGSLFCWYDLWTWCTQLVARIELEKKGYDGALWKEEDFGNPIQYQIWNLNVIKAYSGNSNEIEENKNKINKKEEVIKMVEKYKCKKLINEDLVVLPTEEAEKTFNEKWVTEINNYIRSEGQPTITLQKSSGYVGITYKNVFITKASLRPTNRGFSEIVFTTEEGLRGNKRVGADMLYLNDFFKIKDKVSLKTRVIKRSYKKLSDLSPISFINLLNNLAEEKLAGYEERKGKSATAILTKLRDTYLEEDKVALRKPLLDSIESITFSLPYGEDHLADIFSDAEGKVEKDLEAAYNKFQIARDIFFKKYGLNENSFNQEKTTLGKKY